MTRKLATILKFSAFVLVFAAIGMILGWHTRNIADDNVRLISIAVTVILYLLIWLIR